jgi:hypothetical protein
MNFNYIVSDSEEYREYIYISGHELKIRAHGRFCYFSLLSCISLDTGTPSVAL